MEIGTSDTLFAWVDNPVPRLEGHILCSPVDPNAYMALLCYKNGSMTRERVRDRVAGGSWTEFNENLCKVPPGNNGNLGLYFDEVRVHVAGHL